MSLETCVASERLIEHAQRHFVQSDLDLIKRACAFAEEHYADLVHPTGNLYIQYTLAVAEYLAEIGSEPSVVAAAMICPPLVEGKVLDALKKDFKGEDELLELVEEVLQISYLEEGVWPSVRAQNESRERKEILRKMFLIAIDEMKNQTQEQKSLTAVHFQKKERQLENLIRMFLATATDIRALVIKLVDHLHFIRIIKDLPFSSMQIMNYKLLAKITLEIYAPMVDRLGMWRLKSELEDMSFRLLEPDKYKDIARQLDLKKQERESYIAHIIPTLEEELEAYGIKAEIFGRAKHIYSIYNKMQAKQLPFNEINDLLGVRIIVNSNDDCYYAQSILHEYWPPLTEVYDGKAGRDWIANPKENLYQSLHTTILFEGKAVEVQIRTSAMHKIAEYGVTAAHWRYKDNKTYRKGKIPRVTKTKDRIWNELLAELRKQLAGADYFTAPTHRGFLKYWVFVITPMGHVLGFPSGATPLDFAYLIHTSLGHMYMGAKVNGRIVSLDYTLKNGDIVELLISRAREIPNPEWLSKSRVDDALKKDDTFELLISRVREGSNPEWLSKDKVGYSYYVFARTRRARSKIRNKLNKQKLIA